ncbi:hypothetical protein P5V15_001021 [Pogonomyrmex californicus]
MNEEWLEGEWLENTYPMENCTDKSTTESTSIFTKSSEVIAISVNDQFSPITSFHSNTFIFINPPDRTFFPINNPRLPLSISSTNSITSSSRISSRTPCPFPVPKITKKRKLNTDGNYTGAIKALTDSIKQPIIIKSTNETNNILNASDPIDTCMVFVGSIKTF